MNTSSYPNSATIWEAPKGKIKIKGEKKNEKSSLLSSEVRKI